MAIFDYKNLNTAKSIELMETSKDLAVYGNMAGYMGLPADKLINLLGKSFLADGIYTNQIHVGLPKDWTEVKPVSLNLTDDALDSWGYYQIESPLTGFTTGGPQAKIVEHRDENGKIDQLSVVYAGTNSLVDLPDYFQINENTIAPNMNPLLEKVKEYALANDLTSEDILITGYSLGAGMTNVMAKNKDQFADGFFANAKYVAHESPYIYEDGNVILNMGFENDVVYRIIGNEPTMQDAIEAADFGLVNPDYKFDSTFDNIIIFNDTYASPLWNFKPFSILNIPTGWNAHASGTTSDAISRIGHSSFYEFTDRDSTVVVSGLTALKRWYTWVEDKYSHTSDHYETPAFIIGSKYNDLLKGNIGGDYIDAGKGNDYIKLGEGNDRVDGGEGKDTVLLEGTKEDWDFYKIDDSNYFINSHNGLGLKQLENVEQIRYQDGLLWNRATHDINTNQMLDATVGTEQDDQIEGSVIFAGKGDDTLKATGNNNLLHGGEGNDILIANGEFSALYGAEGNDVLFTAKGDNLLSGGVGDDGFSFSQVGTKATITDFNAYSGDHDQLFFSKEIFASERELSFAISQQGDDVLIKYDAIDVTVQNSLLNDVLLATAII